MLIYSRLNEALVEVQKALSGGDFETARFWLRKARSMNAKINRSQLRLAKVSDSEWASQQGASETIVTDSLALTKNISQSWRVIANWLDSVIKSVSREELLRSSEGINILLDRFLPFHWDMNNDVVVLSGPRAEEFLTLLVARGQAQIIIVVEQEVRDEERIRKLPPQDLLEDNQADDVVICTVGSDVELSKAQLAAFRKVEPPGFVSIPTDPFGKELRGYASLKKRVSAQFITQSTQRLLPTIQSEHFINNLPRLFESKTAVDLAPDLAGKNVLIVSPGPSLLDSVPDIKACGSAFIKVALLRSLPVLLDHGIIPDFVILLDPSDHTADGLDLLPRDSRCQDIPLIVTECAHPTTFDSIFREYVVVPTRTFIGSPLSAALHGSGLPVVRGTSVATFAVSLFAQLGVESITLVGQDLCVSDVKYASEKVNSERQNKTEADPLTCKGISGEDLPTRSNFLLFISEFERLGSTYFEQIRLFNCTRVGAFLANWNHLPLDQNHPVVKASVTPGAGSYDVEKSAEEGRENSSSWKIKKDICAAIEHEIAHQQEVEVRASSLVNELRILLTSGGEDTSTLEELEKELAVELASRGWLTNFYTLPAKLDVDATLCTIKNLEENLMVSLDYYLAIKGSAQHLMDLLHKSQAQITAS